MTKEGAEKRVEKLRELINKYRYSRHVLDKELVPIDVEDSLKKELFDLEQKFPQLITPDSPTQRVGGKPLEKFEKVRHPEPMLSFNDAFSEKDMEDWLERISKLLAKEEISKAKRTSFSSSPSPLLHKSSVVDFYCEPKLDGLAIELIYSPPTTFRGENLAKQIGQKVVGGKNRILKTGSTRGDGIIGEDVTQNLKTIEAIPLRLKIKNVKLKIPDKVVVRGEVIITKKEFEKINKEKIKRGEVPFANPRNLAAGSVRQLDPKVTSQRHLDSTCYELITDFGQKTHEEKHKILKALGFKTNNKYSKYCQNLNEVFEFHNFWLQNRGKLPYEIDGLVVTVNNNEIFEKLGVVGKAPRGAIAYKFPLKQATTIVEDIKVQVGRTGAVTPVAFLKPVEVGGVTISRATLHNEDEIKRLGVKIGDTVIVGRAGDVIPDIIKVLPELRTGKEREFRVPKKCPACQKKLIKPEGEAVWRCPNPKCFARQREYFYHFVKAFNIAGVGPKIVDRLIDEGLVSDPADLFKLEEGDILPLERFAEKSAQNLISAIQSKKKISLSRFIYALGIRNVGEETSIDLAEYFGSIEKIKNAFLEELQKIMDIGPVVAKNIYDWFQEKRNLEFLEKLKKSGVEVKPQHVPRGLTSAIQGKTFVLTGSLETMTREEAKEKIRLLGGEISESVSQKTDYVIVGKEPGLKYEKAKKLGIKALIEKEFLKMLKYYKYV